MCGTCADCVKWMDKMAEPDSSVRDVVPALLRRIRLKVTVIARVFRRGQEIAGVGVIAEFIGDF